MPERLSSWPSDSKSTAPICAPWPTGCSARRAKRTMPSRKRGFDSAAPMPRASTTCGLADHGRCARVPRHAAVAYNRGARSRSPRTRRSRSRPARAGAAPSRKRSSRIRSGSRCSSCSTGWRRRNASPSCSTTCSPCRSRRSRRSSAVPRRRRASSPAGRDGACAAAAAGADADLVRQREVVDAFLAALRGGDFEGLLAVLDPDLVVRADLAAPSGAPAEVRGAAVWAKQAVAFGQLARLVRPALVNGAIGVVMAPRGRLTRALTFTIANGKITEIEVIGDPARLGELDVSIVD